MILKSFVKQIKMENKKENMLVQLNVGDLEQLIKDAVKEEITKIIQLKPEKEKTAELLTREEVSKMLKVSYTTLFNWNNEGILKTKKLGKRVFYLRSEVINQLNPVA